MMSLPVLPDSRAISGAEVEAHRELLNDILWRQWTAIGARSHGESWGASYVDLEALVIATAWAGRDDPRLFDVMLEWLETHGELVSLTRLKNMSAKVPSDVRRLAMSVLRIAEGRPRPDEAEGELTPLFFQKNRAPLPVLKKPDVDFAKEGYSRSAYSPRSVIGSIPLDMATIQLRLRAMIGVGTKAEILLFLSTTSPHGNDPSAGPGSFVEASPAMIARQCHYSKMSVGKALRQMAKSGWIAVREENGRPKYRLSSEDWEQIALSAGRCDMFSFLSMLCSTNEVLSDPEFRNFEALGQASMLRDAFLNSGWDLLGGKGDLMTVSGRGEDPRPLQDVTGTDVLKWFRDVINRLDAKYGLS